MRKIDCIIIHYSLPLLYDTYIPRESLERIRDFKGPKVLFIQDEYRRVNFICDKIRYARIDAVFTCAPKEVAEQIYSSLDGRVDLLPTLTGYASEQLEEFQPKPIRDRSTCVGYRARKCPFWYGRKAFDKYLIGKLFLEHTKSSGLRCDISSDEKHRLYGDKWINFLSDCKATLGTESGASLIDFTGEIEYALNRYQAFHPFREFEQVPPHLLEKDGEIELQVISPRCFEAASLGTVMIQYPGRYSGLLEAGRHYLVLEKDFSNVQEVIEQLMDIKFLQDIADNARHDLVDSGKFSYRQFVFDFDVSINKQANLKQWSPLNESVELAALPKAVPVTLTKWGIIKNYLLRSRKFLWKHLPHWFRFFLGVTLLKKKIYEHLNTEKHSYLTTAN